jgi:hypothetical protein
MAAMDNVRKEGYLMATTDTCCTIVPYFKVNQGRLDEFKSLCTKMIERTSSEPKCLYYGFSFSGDAAHSLTWGTSTHFSRRRSRSRNLRVSRSTAPLRSWRN